MATATVTVKVTPFELQVIDLALQFLKAKAVEAASGQPSEFKVSFELFGDSPNNAARLTDRVRNDLGLK